ncbi:MAG TPA: lipid II flippase MurJ [Patescibacteria group bacterium]|nr:lipid II flippase MurJ [Patescibacteria group bacterium]
MPKNFLQKGLTLLLAQQTNILSAAFIIMATVLLSQVLGWFRQRLLISTFGLPVTGLYYYATNLPDSLFQIIISGALSSAFIPVFSQYLVRKEEKEGYHFASSLLSVSLVIFFIVSVILFIFANTFVALFVAPGLPASQIAVVGSLMRIILAGEMLFIVASFLSSILQCYNQFLIPGFASALYNFGILIGIVFLSPFLGIYAASWGVVIGACLFILMQVPFVMRVGFRFQISLEVTMGIKEVLHLMWPRTLAITISNIGILLTGIIISYLSDASRNLVIFDSAKTLAFAPVALFGLSIAQAAFPVLSRQKGDRTLFKETLLASFMQTIYIILPIAVLLLVLRIPIVRLAYGVAKFDWAATVLTGRTLAFFALSIFAQSLINLLQRAFWALHDTRTPLIVVAVSTVLMMMSSVFFLFSLHLGVDSIALAYFIGSLVNFIALFLILDKVTGGLEIVEVTKSLSKIFIATILTGIALYIPIKILDKVVFDTTKTFNLILLTGIASLCGLLIYLLLTWVLRVKEAETYIMLLKRAGNWREILYQSDEVIETTKISP